MTPTEELCKSLKELGVEYETRDYRIGQIVDRCTLWGHDGQYSFIETLDAELNTCGALSVFEMVGATPAQAIAVAVGANNDEQSRTPAKLSKRLREVYGLHAFAELFGFDWTDDSDWTWHDVACEMADAVDAATVGAGTCHIIVQDNLDETEGMGDVWLECDACHWQMPLEPSTPRFKYCPNCGARIEVRDD